MTSEKTTILVSGTDGKNNQIDDILIIVIKD